MADFDHHPSPLSLAIAILSSSSDHHLQSRRGPNYAAYSKLRESRLRKRRQLEEQSYLTTPTITPTPKKKKEARSPMVARSVPDFASALRKEKENRKPPSVSRLDMSMASASPLPPKGPTRCAEAASLLKTPSPVGALRRAVVRGSVRKSYSSLKEMKGFSDVDESSGCGRYGNLVGSGARRNG